MRNITPAALTVDEFCQSVGIGKTHFYKERSNNRIHTLKSGRRTLILVTEVEKYLALLVAETAASERN